MKILAGDLLETLYEWPEGKQQHSGAMKVTAQLSYARDQVTYISGGLAQQQLVSCSQCVA